MADVVDVLHRLTHMAHEPAQKLRAAIAEAQAVLDKLDAFADDAEDGAQLIAASDLMPTSSANIPDRAGLTRKEKP
ncbi:hypothetical protein [Arthrobacter sp. Z1-15]